jgi:hypothetical protein
MGFLKCSQTSGLLFLQGIIIHFVAQLRPHKREAQTRNFRCLNLRSCPVTWIEGRENYGVWYSAIQIQALWAAEHD